ncbi:MAG: M23 family metallopeptidase [Clostridia bacterium]|nr:M23 family metallopeptidase [Clostridia bacterium]
MKNKQKTKPTKKRILMYYLILAVCLLVIASITVGIVFGTRNNSGDITIDAGQNTPDDKNPDDDKKPDDGNVVDTNSKYEFITPLKSVTVSQAYVFWGDNTLLRFCLHKGMDFSAPAGTEVYATVDGTVTGVYTNDRRYGGYIEIEHADGVKTVYKYVDPAENLKAGDTVNRGDLIAKVATATGSENKEGDHLHFEVYKNNKMQDPDTYLKLISK